MLPARKPFPLRQPGGGTGTANFSSRRSQPRLLKPGCSENRDHCPPSPGHRSPSLSSALVGPGMRVRGTYVSEFVPLSDFLVILRDCGEPLFIIQKITAVRPPPGRSHRRGSCESLTAPSGCTHTQYGWHLEHLGKEIQPRGGGGGGPCQTRGTKTEETLENMHEQRRRQIEEETSRDRVPPPLGFTPKPGRSHTHMQTRRPGEEKWGYKERSPSGCSPSGKKNASWHITLL